MTETEFSANNVDTIITRNNKDYRGIDIQYPDNKGKNIHIVYQTSLSLFYSRLNFKLKKKTTTTKTTPAVTYFH